MTCQLFVLCFDANEPQRLALFWSGLLGWQIADRPDAHGGATLLPNDDTGFRISFLPTRQPKAEQNRLHFDLAAPADGDPEAEINQLIALGATRIDTGGSGEDPGDVGLVALADPDGNEFYVLTAR